MRRVVRDEWANQSAWTEGCRSRAHWRFFRSLEKLEAPAEAGVCVHDIGLLAKRISAACCAGRSPGCLSEKRAGGSDRTRYVGYRRRRSSSILARGKPNGQHRSSAFSENDGLERRLRSLHSHALLYSAIPVSTALYAFPFLLMRDSRPNAKPRIAPVLLWPARVLPEVGIGDTSRWDTGGIGAPTSKPNTYRQSCPEGMSHSGSQEVAGSRPRTPCTCDLLCVDVMTRSDSSQRPWQ